MHAREVWEERHVRLIAGGQHGVISRAQLLRAGIHPYVVTRRIRSGRLEVVQPGVYYVDCTPATWKTQVLAAVMAAGPDAVASHRTAGVLWEMDGIFGRMIEVTVPYSESPVPEGTLLHRTRRINPRAEVDGIPVSPPERALLDMAGRLNDRTLWKAARSAVHRGTTTVRRMDQAVGLFGGRGVGGTRRMRRVIAVVGDDESGSAAEIDLKDIVVEAPIALPIQQLQIPLQNGTNAYPDFVWPDRMRIVEVDGFGAHGSPEQLEADLVRQNQLMDLGWEIRRFTASRIREDPNWVRAEVISFVNKPFREDLVADTAT